MRDPAHLWPLVVVAVGADTWSVLAADGLTAALVEGRAPIALNWLAAHLPVPGIGPSPLLGLGDLVFVGFLAGACTQVDLSRHRTVVGLGVGLGLCLAALVVTPSSPLRMAAEFGPARRSSGSGSSWPCCPGWSDADRGVAAAPPLCDNRAPGSR
jgi:hypothetical protein